MDELYSLSLDERKKIFSKEINELEKLYSELKNEGNRFNPHEEKAWSSLQKIIIFFRKMTGYNCGWVAEEVIEHCSNAGRGTKYTPDDRLFNSIIIDQISKRGCSPRQAIILLAKMMNDKNVSPESTQKELTDTYREYKENKINQNYQEITDIGWVIADMLNFDLSKEYTSNEAAFSEALEAHKTFWQDVINIMKEYHPIIAKHDNGYPQFFGCVIEWLAENYKNPIEYFYKHSTHQTVPFIERRNYLAAYIDAISFFQDKKVEKILYK